MNSADKNAHNKTFADSKDELKKLRTATTFWSCIHTTFTKNEFVQHTHTKLSHSDTRDTVLAATKRYRRTNKRKDVFEKDILCLGAGTTAPCAEPVVFTPG